MKIERIEIRKIHLPYVSPFETSGWRETGRYPIIVRVDADGVTGWGETAVGTHPFYSEECTNGCMVIMRDYLVPMLLDAEIEKAEDVPAVYGKVRGNRMAKSGVEFAVWDLFGRMQGKSLAEMLCGERGTPREKVEVGVSVGIQPSIDELVKVVGEYIDDGYQRIKLKIKPGWDIEPTRAIRETWPDIKLQVDANSIYHAEDAAHLAKLDVFDLLLIEQPLEHDDIFDHAKIKPQIKTPMCLDESIVSPAHCRWAIEMDACDIVNIKPARIGGFVDSLAIHDMCQANGWPVWHGGMLETGIGRAGNVALASLPNFSLPGDISANDRYYARDVVTNPFTLNDDSTLSVPTAPGNGVVVDEAFLDEVTVEKFVLPA